MPFYTIRPRAGTKGTMGTIKYGFEKNAKSVI